MERKYINLTYKISLINQSKKRRSEEFGYMDNQEVGNHGYPNNFILNGAR